MGLNLNKSGKPPAKLPLFLGTPRQFVQLAREYAGGQAWQWGLPNLIGGEQKQSDSHAGVSLHGLALDGGKRAVPEHEIWVTAQAVPAQPGQGSPANSTLAVEVRRGEYTPAVANQIGQLLAHLEADGWLAK